jgi:hypothetical protein
LTRFQSEFEEIKSGKRGTDLQQRNAQEFVDSFIELDGDPAFRMGSPEHKQGRIDPEYRKEWEKWLADGKNLLDAERTAYVKSLIDGFSLPPGKLGDKYRNQYMEEFCDALIKQDLEWWFQRNSAQDETPSKKEQSVKGFRLSDSPVLNRWYRLYDPEHGLRQTDYKRNYQRISDKPDCPVIYVSWYDAWAFCKWANWKDENNDSPIECYLPTELEWEYAAKGGKPWDWDYWWGSTEYRADLCNANRQKGKTLPPSANRANPFGLMDMLGNVVEWCADWYQTSYGANESDPSARVLRGGSWYVNPLDCRSAYRGGNPPATRSDFVGFRVARAQPRKP